MRRLNLSVQEMDDKWSPLKIGNGKVKLGGGFYAGLIDGLYVINGFYLAMRNVYTTPGRSITWYALEWASSDLSWADFRQRLVGDTDPANAEDASLRGAIHRAWRELGLDDEPDTGHNAVHASASPFESLVERCNWLGRRAEGDPFGQEILARGVSPATLQHWTSDPVVEHQGVRTSLFDLFENLDSEDCIETALELPIEMQGTYSGDPCSYNS